MNDYIINLNIHKVKIVVKGPFINLFLKRINRMHINAKEIRYIDKNTITLITNKDSYKILKKEFKDFDIKKIQDLGVYNYKNFYQKNKIFLISLFLGIILFIVGKNIIVQVNVIHSDKKIRQLVTDELEQNGIKRLTFKKNYKQIQKIKQNILNKYPDTLEWIEIENEGMSYTIRIEQRIFTKIKESNKYCNIIATKSGVLTKVISDKGNNIKESKDYVSEGDVIVSGQIKVNEEIKQDVCASGKAYAEVWYTVDASIPLDMIQKVKTGKTKINFMIDNGKEKKVILKSRFKNSVSEDKKIFSLFGITLYYQKEHEVVKKVKQYTEKEAINQALEKTKEKINIQLDDDEKILTQKVLNKTKKNSTIEVEIFVAVEEQIGVVQEYQKEKIENEEMR